MQLLRPPPRLHADIPQPHWARHGFSPEDDCHSASNVLGSTLIHTKTQVPRHGGDMLRRERLEKLSGEVQQRLLTLVMAPPGCGKTTLARQWAGQLASHGSRVAWLSIDADDNDPQRFLLYLSQAVARAGFDIDVTNVISDDPYRSLSEMSLALINRVTELGDELVIVLDNYSWITDTKIHCQVSYILNNAPSNLHLVVLASDLPPLPIARLRVRNQLLELNGSTISFNKSEMLEFLRGEGRTSLQAGYLDEVYRLTSGWAAAVRIVSVTASKFAESLIPHQGITDCGAFEDAIDEYLDDLFFNYPEDLIEMMIDTSIVDSVSLPLCISLTENSDTETFFCQLRQQQLLMPHDLNRGLFTYHAPVRSYLRKKLATRGHKYLSMLYRRAYDWYSQNSLWENAIECALASGDVGIALGWMEGHGMSILKAGKVGSLIKWHKKVSSLPVYIPLRVQLSFAWAYALSHFQDSTLELLAAIDTSPNCRHPAPTDIQAECEAIRAVAYALADRSEQVVELSKRCSGYRFSDNWVASVIANIELYCRLRAGQWAAFFSETTILNGQGEGEMNTHILRLSMLGFAGLLRGQLGLAEKYCNEALRISPAQKGKDILHFSAWPTGVLASIYYEQGRLDEIRVLLNGRMNRIASSGYLDCTMGAFLSAARVAARMESFADAMAILDQAESIAIKRKWQRLEAAVLLERLCLYLNEDRQDEAKGCFQRLLQLPRDGASEKSSPFCSAIQMVEIAKAQLAIHSGRAEEAVDSLPALIVHFAKNGNELFAVRLGTLLSIAYLKAGRDKEADKTFRETVERSEKGGFVSAILDQGPETVRLLSGLCASLKNGSDEQRLRKHCERMLRDWKRVFDPSRKNVAVDDGKGHNCSTLTLKEHMVLTLMARGQSNKEIARSLSVGPETIKTHLKNIFFKLSVDRRLHAVAKAQSLGLLAREYGLNVSSLSNS